ncbi:hypothetical protein LCGC14_2691370 [marine sediment metagenome]|uniref:Uncharacterized protein n=1 Tax=marine sediment metagenome TaxID=412755 RepID=A0A0F9BT49_9ZZZZ
MANKPHSDKSNRAERRRQDKAIEKAQKIVQANPQVQSTPITMVDMLAKIGVLTLEVDVLRKQLSQVNIQNVEAAVEELKEEELEESSNGPD